MTESTIWANRTNKGRVVYNRKMHAWTAKDVDRVVRKFSEQSEPDVLMMSQLADRVLYWVAQRLALDELAGFAAKVVVRLFNLVRGIRVAPEGDMPKILNPWDPWSDVEDQPAALDPDKILDRTAALQRIRLECVDMIATIDREVPPDGERTSGP